MIHFAPFLLLLAMSGCATRLVNRFELVDRGGYAYQRLNDGEFAVAALNNYELNRALGELGCDSQFICLVEVNGSLYRVLQRAKD